MRSPLARIVVSGLLASCLFACENLTFPPIKSCKVCGERKWLVDSAGGCIGRLYDFPAGLIPGLLESRERDGDHLKSCTLADSDRYKYGYGTDRSSGTSIVAVGNGGAYLLAYRMENFSFNGVKRVSGSADIVLQLNGSNTPKVIAEFDSKLGLRLSAIATDNASSVLVAGLIDRDLTMCGRTLINFGFLDILLLKYSKSGECLWASSIGTNQEDYLGALGTDDEGNIFVTFSTFPSSHEKGKYTFSIVKLSPGGDVLFKETHDLAVFYGSTLSIDRKGRLLVAGNYLGGSGRIGIVAMFTRAGKLEWYKLLGDSRTADVTNLSASFDSDGDMYLAGFASGDVDGLTRAPYPGVVFLAKYAGDGGLLWSRDFIFKPDKIMGPHVGYALPEIKVAADLSGNAMIAASVEGQIEFGGGLLENRGRSDLFFAKFSADGEYRWSESYGSFSEDRISSVAIDGSGSLSVTGTFSLDRLFVLSLKP